MPVKNLIKNLIMKNNRLVAKLQHLKQKEGITILEGFMLRNVRGGGDPVLEPCKIKCKPNNTCQVNCGSYS